MNKQEKLSEFEAQLLKYKKGLSGWNGTVGFVRDLIDEAESEKNEAVQKAEKRVATRFISMYIKQKYGKES